MTSSQETQKYKKKKKKKTHTHKHQSKAHQCKKKPTTKQSKDSPQNIRIKEMTESSLIFTFLL
jgi:hypothetical protein